MNGSYTGPRHQWLTATEGRICQMCGIQERLVGKRRYYTLRLNPEDKPYLGLLPNRFYYGRKMPPCDWGPQLRFDGEVPEEAVEGDW